MVVILDVKRSIDAALFGISEVVGTGIDWPGQAIRVYVDRYTPAVDRKIPEYLSGYPVDVIETGVFTATLNPGVGVPIPYRRMKWRPVYGGISAGHALVTAGTLGAVVIDVNTGGLVALSNNHVFAREATDHSGAEVGDAIIQPSLYDAGTILDGFATLERWIPLDADGENLVDCAIAVPTEDGILIPNVVGGVVEDGSLHGIAVQGMASVTGGEIVHKYGRTTGHTSGSVIDVDFTTKVQYPSTGQILFTDQILACLRVDGGDSGSLLLDDQNRAVGLVIASAKADGVYYAIANKIQNVATMIGISFPETDDVFAPGFNLSATPSDVASRIPGVVWVAAGVAVGATMYRLFGKGLMSSPLTRR